MGLGLFFNAWGSLSLIVAGFVASLALVGAVMAKQAASGKIEKELEDLTKNYLNELQRYLIYFREEQL